MNKKTWWPMVGLGLLILTTLTFLSALIYLMIFFPIAGWTIFVIGYGSNLIFYTIHSRKTTKTSVDIKKSWAVTFLFLPLFASLYYLWGSWISKRTFKKYKEIEDENNKINLVNPIKELEENSLFSINEKQFKSPVFQNSKIVPITEGSVFFEMLFKEMSNAKKFINIQFFILNTGIIFNKFREIILKKAKEGVKINILTDYVGNAQNNDEAYYVFKDTPNIKFNIFNKFTLLLNSGIANVRNHNKVVIIDNEKVFFGGMNIGDDYTHLYSKYGYWNDVHFLGTGEIVGEYIKKYALDFHRQFGNKIPAEFLIPHYEKFVDDSSKFQVLSDGPFDEKSSFLESILYLIKNVKKSIKIITPYFVIPTELEKALFEAKKRKIDIKIIVAGKPDKKTAYIMGEFYVDKMVGKGIEMLRPENMFCHAKMYIFDDENIVIGTSNFDFRAIYYHFETNVLIQSKEFVKTMNQNFDHFFKKSYKETTSLASWSFTKKVIYQILKIFAPLL